MATRLAIAALSAAFLCSFCTVSRAQNQAPAAADPSAQAPQNPTTQGPSASPAAGNRPQPGAPRIAPGFVIPVQLTKSIDAKKAKPGDQVVVTVTIDLKTISGEVIVPKETRIVGHVTQAQARTKEQKESDLGIAFDRALTKKGEMVQPMSIQAIIAPLNNDSGASGGNGPSGPATGGGTATSPMAGRAPLSGAAPPRSPSAGGTDAQAGGSSRPLINSNTQGIIGMPELKLEANTQNAALGSVVSSEKSTVKLESGTLMLLRVN
jgi:hypothetical protein